MALAGRSRIAARPATASDAKQTCTATRRRWTERSAFALLLIRWRAALKIHELGEIVAHCLRRPPTETEEPLVAPRPGDGIVLDVHPAAVELETRVGHVVE